MMHIKDAGGMKCRTATNWLWIGTGESGIFLTRRVSTSFSSSALLHRLNILNVMVQCYTTVVHKVPRLSLQKYKIQLIK
jgi:hypothetical protein